MADHAAARPASDQLFNDLVQLTLNEKKKFQHDLNLRCWERFFRISLAPKV